MSTAQRTRLDAGLKQLGLHLPDDIVERLLAYIQLFEKWNKTYNLSAVRDINAMISRHLLDSLAILPFVEGQRLIDVGTGGGLPGIPMAICHPEREVHLLDSNGKKTRFLFQVKTLLGLDNVQVHNCRVESYQPEALFDGVMSRAFASLEDMTNGCQHLIKENGRFWAMKGIYPTDELKPLEKNYIVANSHALTIPGEEGERHLLEIRPR
ncbi:16S rRNA (guanine(527)-N(7))-methyltransferase RsmG [Pseudoteredinibacter isoporae]|uniref:16S rRNA (guanine(527)-N(7))-methyltransferase RsmG n=1 Tax=Pseudoteredinibacter isoporae TaxID=570281 RepID=UPI003102FE00